jgi:hypothetical protein
MQIFLDKIYSEKCVLGIKQHSLTRSQPFLCRQSLNSKAQERQQQTMETGLLTSIQMYLIDLWYIKSLYWFGLWCLAPRSTIFKLYPGSQFYF